MLAVPFALSALRLLRRAWALRLDESAQDPGPTKDSGSFHIGWAGEIVVIPPVDKEARQADSPMSTGPMDRA
jgi:hypothetical protein